MSAETWKSTYALVMGAWLGTCAGLIVMGAISTRAIDDRINGAHQKGYEMGLAAGMGMEP